MDSLLVRHPVALSAALLWIGFVCAISFMEAWLKFRAPGVTMPLGLGIGRIVFSALNKMEWLFALAVAADLLLSRGGFSLRANWLYLVPLILIAIQTLWLLPALDVRAEQYIQGQPIPRSNLHFYYVGMELLKVACLGLFAISLFNKNST